MGNVIKKIKFFSLEFIKKFRENEIIYLANAFTYKLLLAMFPFGIFLMTLLGFFDIEISDYVKNIIGSMPKDVKEIFLVFIEEVVYTKNVSLLSISLLISIFSASSGFNYFINGVNKVFDIDDSRGFIKKRLLSILLVFVFTFLIIASLILFIFCDAIEDFLVDFLSAGDIIKDIFGMTGYIINVIVLFVILIIMFRISLYGKIRFKQLVPGTLIVVCGWLFMSKIFNIYINNFSKISVVYGSLGSIFVLLIWINMISLLILSGSQINAIILKKSDDFKKDGDV